MRVRIFQPPKSATQSGYGKTHGWTLVFGNDRPRRADPLMGWVGGGNTQAQVALHFDTKEEAIAYAERSGLAYDLELPQTRHIRPKAYADNFRYGRLENWTH